LNQRSREASDLQSDAIDRSAISPYMNYCTCVSNHFISVGDHDIEIIPNNIENQIIITANQNNIKAFLVHHRFFSAHAFLPIISTN
jgi:hypothetical protein